MKKYLVILTLLMSFSVFAQYPAWVNKIKYTPILKGNYNPNDSLPVNNRLCAMYLDTVQHQFWEVNKSKTDWVKTEFVEAEILTAENPSAFTITRNHVAIKNFTNEVTLNIPADDDYFNEITFIRDAYDSDGDIYITANSATPNIETWEGGLDYGVIMPIGLRRFTLVKLDGIYYIKNQDWSSAYLDDNVITTAKIADGTILTDDIADEAINSAKITDGTITDEDFAVGAINLSKLAQSDATTGQVPYWDGGQFAPRSLVKADVGLNNVDNTSDLSKPVSTATQTALDAKQATITLTTTGTSGAATLSGSTLNIPQYSGGGSANKKYLQMNITSTSNIDISTNAITGLGYVNLVSGDFTSKNGNQLSVFANGMKYYYSTSTPTTQGGFFTLSFPNIKIWNGTVDITQSIHSLEVIIE